MHSWNGRVDAPLNRARGVVLLRRKLATAAGLPVMDLELAVVCWVMLAMTSLLLAMIPSRLVLRSLGVNIGAVTFTPTIDPLQLGLAERVSRAIAIAAANAPFRANCYPQALVVARLCRWMAIPHAIHLGARFASMEGSGAGSLEGHAWVCSGSLTICGDPASPREFGTVACFVHLMRRQYDHVTG